MPPQHSVTAPITYVSVEAFDTDLILAERESLPGHGDDHPVVRYVSGRRDIDAPYPINGELKTARDYLRPDHGMPVWTGRRLRASEVARCMDKDTAMASLSAFAAGLVSCSLDSQSPSTKWLSDQQVDAYVDRYGMAEVLAAGAAFLEASKAPTYDEKKP